MTLVVASFISRDSGPAEFVAMSVFFGREFLSVDVDEMRFSLP